MTPKEKAEFLVGKYLSLQFGDFPTTDAKYCALIAVDEILGNNFLEPQIKRHVGSVEPTPMQLEYWFQVKKEIQNL